MSHRTYADFLALYLGSKLSLPLLRPRTPHPLRSSIRLTERCNSRCITCGYWQQKWTDAIPYERAVSLIKELKDLGVERLRFSGGEPLVRKDFIDILKTIGHGDFKKLTVATNGLLLARYADALTETPVTDLGVSLDGLRETNDFIRGVDGYFDKAIDGIRKTDKRVTIMTTLMKKNAGELVQLFDLCEELGVLWDFNLLDDSLFFFKDIDLTELWPEPELVDEMLDTIRANMRRPALKRVNEHQLAYAGRYLKRQKFEEPPCYLGYTDIDIDSSGQLFTGCYVLKPIGNILEQSVREILCTDAYRKRLHAMVERQCPGCTCGYELNMAIENLPKRAFQHVFLGKKK